jgi:hypothetical protein
VNLTQDQKDKMRGFLALKGSAVKFDSPGYHGAQAVSTYGWFDAECIEHMTKPTKSFGNRTYGEGCTWVVPSGVVLREVTYSMFTDTFSGNKDEVGVECSPVSCACGKYTDMTLRWVGSLGDLMFAIFGPEVPDTGVTL